MNAQKIFELLKLTYKDWNEDKAPRLGAALAYYTVFSIAPLLVIVISLVGIFFGDEAAKGEISAQISRVVGDEAAGFIETMIAGANKPGGGNIVATLIGFATLLMGAMGVFGQLQDALNTIWEVQPKPGRSFFQTVKDRLTPFVMIIGVAFLLLSSLAVSAGISAMGEWMESLLPLPAWVMQTINLAVGFVIITLLFAMIFKVLPDVEIQWRDVWIGAGMTTVLFMLGQLALSWYVSKTAASSTYGAAGSLVAVLLWVYWTSQILFFGAEFTQVYANKYGSHLKPAPNAIPVTAEARAQQGLSPRDSKLSDDGAGDKSKSKPDNKPVTRNLLAEARRENEGGDGEKQSEKNQNAQRDNAQRDFVEDVGTILAGVGIVMIFKRMFRREEKTP